MGPLRRTARLAVAGGLLATTPAAATVTPLATTDAPTPVSASGSVAVFSLHDASGFRLAVSENGAAPRVLPVAPRTVPFDADIGPDGTGGLALVYSRCAQDPDANGAGARGCDLYRFRLKTGLEQRIASAGSAGTSEREPAISGRTIVFAQTRDGAPDAAPKVLLRDVTWQRSRASKPLPGVPTRRCGPSAVRGEQVCRTTRRRQVTSLDLSNRHVALAVAYDAGADSPDSEIRLDTRDGRQARSIAHVSPGISGQRLIGPSLEGDRLHWARTCGGDQSGCPATSSGAFRYRLGTGRYELAGFTRRLTGFAATGARRAYEVRAPEMPGGYCGNSLPEPRAVCQVVVDDALPSFRPVKAPL
ncbi:MAG TPA: hypothetical protein VN238_05235 [Solirubrobacteraceae bacterium]|nr:hypothetical protein [Solirubrobacteraceae bacterium]